MKRFCVLLILALAVMAAGMMGPPGMGPGGPPGALGPPPFIQALIASKGKPFGAGGAPGALGPPPFVQQIIASKGMPFGGGPIPEASAAQQPGVGPTATSPALMGIPSYVQSLMAAKAASVPFMPASVPMGPPPFIQQLLAAKAAQEAAMAQQLAAASQTGGDATPGQPSPANMTSPPQPPNINLGPPPFVQSIIQAKGSPSSAAPAAISPADWVQQLIQSQIAQKLASKTSAGVAPAAPQPAGAASTSMIQQKRDAMTGTDVDSQVAPPQAAPFPPQLQYPPFPMPMGYPPFPPMPYPMMPFYPIPPWKMMG